jgi:hypothetical protein
VPSRHGVFSFNATRPRPLILTRSLASAGRVRIAWLYGGAIAYFYAGDGAFEIRKYKPEDQQARLQKVAEFAKFYTALTVDHVGTEGTSFV